MPPTLFNVTIPVIQGMTSYLQPLEKLYLSGSNKYWRRVILTFPLLIPNDSATNLQSLVLFLKRNPHLPGLGLNYTIREHGPEPFWLLNSIVERFVRLQVNGTIFPIKGTGVLKPLPKLTELHITPNVLDMPDIGQSCPNLHTLTVEKSHIKHSTAISSLTELTFISCLLPEVLTGLALFPNLRKFSLLHCITGPALTFPVLTQLPRLEEFTLEGIARSLDFLRDCLTINKLRLSSCALVKDITIVGSCLNLREIALDNLQLKNMCTLNNLPLLQTVVLTKMITNLAETVFPPLIEKLVFLHCTMKGDLQLAKPANLKYCNVSSKWDRNVLLSLKDCVNLIELEASYNIPTPENISHLAKLTRLQNLHLPSLFHPTPLHLLPRLPSLTRLTSLYGGARNLAEVAGCTTLSHLKLVNLNDLTDITHLAMMRTLQDVTITSCCLIADFSPLARCPHLTKLTLNDCEIPDLTGLSDSTSLTELNLLDCNLANFLLPSNIPNLEYLVVRRSDFSQSKLALAGCTQLRVVVIENKNLFSVQELSKCHNLEYVQIVTFNQGLDIHHLQQVPKLTRITEMDTTQGKVALPSGTRILVARKADIKSYDLRSDIWEQYLSFI